MKYSILLLMILSPLTSAASDAYEHGHKSMEATTYNVRISVSGESNQETTTSLSTMTDSTNPFAAIEEHSYIKSSTLTYKWYNKLFGIEPKPQVEYGSFETGIKGTLELTEINKNELLVKLKSTFSEITEMKTTTGAELPSIKTKSNESNVRIQMEKGEKCIQVETNMRLCITKLS
ncbi:hypothetical protein [Vibrio harveyi]|uniref:hypothetical protein n=1 Tax=Vibrio harveyi TaxID=669 RepID=UPI000842035A|nr:hypothetical protein [Vibrio harveyi]ODM57020.1 hypothetical protein BC455_18180 [Vibrio harveyi]